MTRRRRNVRLLYARFVRRFCVCVFFWKFVVLHAYVRAFVSNVHGFSYAWFMHGFLDPLDRALF
jgi:hypothetical protein